MGITATVFAAHGSQPYRDDIEFVHGWVKGDDALQPLSRRIDEADIGTLLIRIKKGWFDSCRLALFLEVQMAERENVFMMIDDFSALQEEEDAGSLIRQLQRCSGILVNTLEALNRLKKSGITGNAFLLAEGIRRGDGASASPSFEMLSKRLESIVMPAR